MDAFASSLLLLTLLAFGCSTTQLVEKPRTDMTVAQARATLAELTGARTVRSNSKGITFVRDPGRLMGGEVRALSDESTASKNREEYFVPFADMGTLELETKTKWNSPPGETPHSQVMMNGEVFKHGQGPFYKASFENKTKAGLFADAVLCLKAAALAPDTEEAEFAEFSAKAATWRQSSEKPKMPESALVSKMVAEDDFKKKDYPGALKAYREALGIHPMWPEGQFNAALLAAEVGDFGMAVHHMRRYLALAPDAPDAEASRAKLLFWQHKAEE